MLSYIFPCKCLCKCLGKQTELDLNVAMLFTCKLNTLASAYVSLIGSLVCNIIAEIELEKKTFL